MMEFSYHAQVERANRISQIESKVGFTRVVLEIPATCENKRYCLTSSGVIIVKALDRDFVITAYLANIKQCIALYRAAGKCQVSPKVYKKVVKNWERHRELFFI